MQPNGTESVKIDWLTLTSWDYHEYLEVVEYLHQRLGGGWEPSKVQQYKGKSNGHIFYGLAQQTDGLRQQRPHAMIRVSGYMADRVFFEDLIWFKRGSGWSAWKCTRLDLESTRTPPKRYNLANAYKRINHPKNCILGENTTLYIGNRAESPIFTRLYEKLGYLRLEFELKKNRAEWAFRALLNGVHPNDLYMTVMSKSRVPVMFVKHFDIAHGQMVDYAEVERKLDREKQLAWLASIEMTIARMMCDHDIGEQTCQIIDRLAEGGQKLDKS